MKKELSSLVVAGLNAALLALTIGLLYGFGRSLQLGGLQGTVFRLYLLYASVGLFLLNAVAAALRYKHQRADWHYFLIWGALVGLIGASIALLAGN